MAAAVPTMPISPRPFTPIGLTNSVVLGDKNHIDVMDVGVDRNMVLGVAVIHETAEIVVEQRFLVKRHANTPHHAAHDLTAGSLGVEDAARGNGIDHARDAHYPEVLVYLHFSAKIAEWVKRA